MMGKKLWFLAILFIIGLTACATMQSDVKRPPLPNDVNIVPPAPDLPKEIAVFSGKWAGTWSNGMAGILVVETINYTEAQVVFSIAYVPQWNLPDEYWRFRCRVIPGSKPKLNWKSPKGEPTSFEVKDSNTIEGILERPSSSFTVIMKRIN